VFLLTKGQKAMAAARTLGTPLEGVTEICHLITASEQRSRPIQQRDERGVP
jgi:hypothetical protein